MSHITFATFAFSLRRKAVSHSKKLCSPLTDRLSEKHFYQVLHQQGTLTQTRPGEAVRGLGFYTPPLKEVAAQSSVSSC